MTEPAATGTSSRRETDAPSSRLRYLVVLPGLQLLGVPPAMVSSRLLGPSHPVTAALGLGLLYGAVLTGPLSLLGLCLDGRRLRQADATGRGPRWPWYAAAAVGLAAALAVHWTYDRALYGLLEPSVALAAAMVPVGLAYRYRRWDGQSGRQ